MHIPDNIRKIACGFAEGLKSVYKDSLVSVVLYGSAASGEYAGASSNINIAVVLKDASIPQIKKAACLARRRKYTSVNPVFFTDDYIRTSTDVFPIEFLDIKENHIVLSGADVFRDILVDTGNLRFQCEQELKSKILNIKKAYLRVRGRAVLQDVLFRAATSGIHIIRNLVRLKGKAPAYKKETVIRDAGSEFSIDTGVFGKILAAKSRGARLSSADIDSMFTDLVSTLETLSDKVDKS